jgi:Lon protease-like protein
MPLLVIVLLLTPALASSNTQRVSTLEVITLPGEMSLFPLPEVVLFPGVSRPLLIFEPRYREMIADALKGNRFIGMVRLRPGFEKDYEGRPPIYGIGCAGIIEQHEQLPDGRYVIVLRGLTTFRVLGEDQSKPYRVGRIETIPELLREEERDALRTVRARLEELLSTMLPPGVDPPDAALGDAEFVNIVAQNLGMPESARQDLLEQNRVVERAQALADLLEKK